MSSCQRWWSPEAHKVILKTCNVEIWFASHMNFNLQPYNGAWCLIGERTFKWLHFNLEKVSKKKKKSNYILVSMAFTGILPVTLSKPTTTRYAQNRPLKFSTWNLRLIFYFILLLSWCCILDYVQLFILLTDFMNNQNLWWNAWTFFIDQWLKVTQWKCIATFIHCGAESLHFAIKINVYGKASRISYWQIKNRFFINCNRNKIYSVATAIKRLSLFVSVLLSHPILSFHSISFHPFIDATHQKLKTMHSRPISAFLWPQIFR